MSWMRWLALVALGLSALIDTADAATKLLSLVAGAYGAGAQAKSSSVMVVAATIGKRH